MDIRWCTSSLLAAALAGTLGCSDLSGLTGSQGLPPGVPDPNSLNNPAGTLTLYATAIYAFQFTTNGANTTGSLVTPTEGVGRNGAFLDAVFAEGLLGDELQSGSLGGSIVLNPAYLFIDARRLSEQLSTSSAVDSTKFGTSVYTELQNVRAASSQAIGALTAYNPTASPALRGHLYALAGYAEILLADLFCSGVPLSTLDFQGDFTYHAGSTTAQVYQHAVVLLDTALTLSTDSVRVLNFARVGKGRALLAAGQYADAANAVASVPDNFSYQFAVTWGTESAFNLFGTRKSQQGDVVDGLTVSNQEGINGLPYVTNGATDPRTATVLNTFYNSYQDPVTHQIVPGANTFGLPQYFPQKYGTTPAATSPITVADGVEARLIQAEAALQAGDAGGWLVMLNRARALVAPSLPALTDPITPSVRVDYMFRERAYDLFLTGHRLGDMRRLIRQYGRDAEQVFPTGVYPSFLPLYGTDITFPVPPGERPNPLFTGCFDRGA